MTNQGLFVLGVGAQKAGTSWVHWYLQQAPQVDCGLSKEYHIWDAVESGVGEPRRLIDPARDKMSPKRTLLWRMQQDPEVYFDYFAGLLAQDGITISADFTPLYAILPAARYAALVDGFARRGIETKVVYLMRDPLARCWSQARMNHRRHKHPEIDFSQDPSAEDILRQGFRAERNQMRTRYDLTIQALEQALPSTAIYYGFYEDMFEPVKVQALSEFFGIKPRPELVRHRVNADPLDQPLSDSTARLVAQEYRGVYEFCAKRWPQVADLWSGFAYL